MFQKGDADIATYCVERLVSGLASARAASRIGFSTALVLILDIVHADWDVNKIFELADKKLDYTDKDSASANGIGQHLLCAAIANSSHYHDVSEKYS